MMKQSPAGAAHPPLFVVGCGRSGTTMLRLMLDSHPDLAIPGEGHFIPYSYRRISDFTSPSGYDGEAAARQMMRSAHFRRWEVPEDAVLERVAKLTEPDFASVVAAVYMAYADLHNKVRWGDKTPVYVRLIPLLAKLWPSARFVHVIRDGHDVALSYLSVPWGPSTIWEVARKWNGDVSAGRRAGSLLGPERYTEVRYEDLIASPAAELERLCEFADLTFDGRMLDYHGDARSRLQVRSTTTDFHRSATKPPTSGMRDWRTQMSPSQVRAFEALAGDTLSEMGYDRHVPKVGAAKRAEVAARNKMIDIKVMSSKAKKRVLKAAGHSRPASPQ
jgi:Sulfotransferase family